MLILRNLLKFRVIITFVLLGVSLQLLAQKDYVRVDGTIFRDAEGRMLMLRGMNYVNKDKANKFLNLTKDEAFVNLKNGDIIL
ncbi:MAG: hypothetical protein KDC72_02870 [Bacteroidetes bacterium]|nr:hypothetical protein [Bacteroidota bacterium]